MQYKKCRCLMLVLFSILFVYAVVFAAPSTKSKEMVKQINKELRAVENSHDAAQAKSMLNDIRKKIDELKAEDPSNPELNTIESKYRRNRGMYKEDTAGEKTGKPEDSSQKKQALQDWEAIVSVYKGFREKMDPVIPHGKSVIYNNSNIDEVTSIIQSLRAETPGIKVKIDKFTAKYGKDIDSIDRKLFELTPLNMKAGRYSEENRRPDESAGLSVDRLMTRMNDLEEAPVFMSRQVLSNAVRAASDIESFPDETRDSRYAEVEKELAIAAKLDPKSEEVRNWQANLQKMRSASKENTDKQLESARFPIDMKNFTGPGKAAELKKSIMAFYDSHYPKEKSVAVSITGNWRSVKTNILGETIQWGLPVSVAAYTKNNPDICRVFNLTMVTAEGRGIKKSPPWDLDWVGNSFRMKTKNISK